MVDTDLFTQMEYSILLLWKFLSKCPKIMSSPMSPLQLLYTLRSGEWLKGIRSLTLKQYSWQQMLRCSIIILGQSRISRPQYVQILSTALWKWRKMYLWITLPWCLHTTSSSKDGFVSNTSITISCGRLPLQYESWCISRYQLAVPRDNTKGKGGIPWLLEFKVTSKAAWQWETLFQYFFYAIMVNALYSLTALTFFKGSWGKTQDSSEHLQILQKLQKDHVQ